MTAKLFLLFQICSYQWGQSPPPPCPLGKNSYDFEKNHLFEVEYIKLELTDLMEMVYQLFWQSEAAKVL